MIRRTALLSALTLSLLLVACSKDKDESADADETQAQAQAERGEQVETDIQAEEAPPPPTVDYWKVVGPLVAGDYSGACMRKPDLRKMDATIKVGADGKASSSGMELDFREARKVMLTRQREKDGGYGAMFMFSVDEAKGGDLLLQSAEGGKGSAVINRDDIGLMCSEVGGIDKLSARPLRAVFSGLLGAKTQTVSCLDTTNLLVRRDTDVEIDGDVLKIGGTKFDITGAETEMFTFDDAGRTMSLTLIMPDKQTIGLGYDGAGTLTSVTVFHEQERSYSCEPKREG